MTKPRPLRERERTLINLYIHCQLEMTPQQFQAKWEVNHEQLAFICFRSLGTVRRWFIKGRYSRRSSLNDLRHLALMDFLLEHFEDIPKQLLDVLCPPRRGTGE
jgi:hypothetical protein